VNRFKAVETDASIKDDSQVNVYDHVTCGLDCESLELPVHSESSRHRELVQKPRSHTGCGDVGLQPADNVRPLISGSRDLFDYSRHSKWFEFRAAV
jgi:hypothetical protein